MLHQGKLLRYTGFNPGTWRAGVITGFGIRIFAVILALIAIFSAGTSPVNAQAYPGKIGINLEGMNYWIRDYMFVDAMKTSRPWAPMNAWWLYGTGPMDATGWPTGDATVLVFDVSPTHATGDPAQFAPNLTGTYHLSFNGQATLSPIGGCSFTVSGQSYNPGTNTTTADIIVPAGQLALNMAYTNTKRTAASATNTGVTNVVMIRPGYPANTTKVFTDVFINSLADFSTLRAMDILDTNINVPVYPTMTLWANRRQKTDGTQSSGIQNPPVLDASMIRAGIAWEYLVDLANLTNKDLWVNIPVAADDNYVTQVATLLKNNLNPGRTVYVEYANEVWNWHTADYPFTWNDKSAQAQKSVLSYDGTTNPTLLQRRCYVKRLTEISNIFRTVYGNAAMNTTLRPVMAWQAIDPDAIGTELDYMNLKYGPPSNYIYAVSEATYYVTNNNNVSVDAGESVNQIIQQMYANSDWYIPYIQGYAAKAAAYNVKLVAYEGGPGLAATPDDIGVYYNVNRDPQMTNLIIHDVTNAFNSGVSLYMYFQLSGQYTTWGMWGLTEDINNLSTPKFQAMDQLSGNAGNSANTHGGTWSDRGIITSTPAWKSTWQVASGVVPGGSYTAGFWLKGTGSAVLIVDSGNWGAELGRQTYQATSTWAYHAFPITAGSTNQLTYVITDGSGNPGTLYVDDCVLGPTSGGNVLANAGFESGGTGWQVDPGSPWTILQPGGGAPPDTTPPSTPGTLSSTGQTTSSISLSWGASTDNVGVTGYNIYNGGTLTTTVTGLTATISGLTAGTAYSFTVKAKDAAGNLSPASNTLNVSTLSANTHGGAWALKGTPTGTPGWRNVWQVVNCTVGSTYTVSYWLKGSGGLTLYVYNGSWGTVNTTKPVTATPAWQLCTYTTAAATSNQLTFILSDASSSGGTFYIDDCFLGNGTNLLANPGFEGGGANWNVDTPSVWSILQNP